LPNAGYRGIQLLETLPHHSKQFVAGTRQADVARGAIKQAESELGFELSNQNAQAGWSDVKCLRGTREASMLGDKQESSTLAGRKFHC
jgi:hypothetical protein